MSSSDAIPVPRKNVAYRLTFALYKNDGTLITGASGLDSEVSKDGGTFADCTNEATEIATNSGFYFLDLTSTEMNADCVAIMTKTSSTGAVIPTWVLYPQETGDIKVDVTSLLGTAWLTPGTAGTPDVNVKLWNALTTVELPLVPTTAGRKLDVSTGGEAGVDWANVGSPTTSLALTGTTIATTQKVDVETIKTNPVVNAGTVTFPTTATLASTTNITAGTIATVTNLTNAPTAGDFTATMKTSIGTAVAASAVASVTGNVGGNVTGSVGSIAAGGIADASYATTAGKLSALGIVDQGTAQAATGTTLQLRSAAAFADDELIGATILIVSGTAGAGQARVITDYVSSTDTATVDAWTTTPTGTIVYKIFATAPASGTGGSAPTAAEVADAVWDELLSGHAVSGSTGEALSAAGTAGDPWLTALPGAYGAGTAGKIIGDNINATISSRATQTSVDTIDDFLDTEVAAIKAKTDNLPSDPADESLIIAATDAIFARLGAPAGASVSADMAAVKVDTAAILVDTGTTLDGRIPAALVGGRMDSSVGAMAANTMTAAAAAADLTTELQTGLATSAAVATLQTSVDDLPTNAELATALGTADDAVLARLGAPAGASIAADIAAAKVDTAAIKTKTDSLTYTVAGQVDANVQRINDVTIVGDGSGTPFQV